MNWKRLKLVEFFDRLPDLMLTSAANEYHWPEMKNVHEHMLRLLGPHGNPACRNLWTQAPS